MWVEPADVREAAYGLTIPAGEAVDASIARLIAKAEQRVLLRVASVPARIEAGTLQADAVAGVVEDMVLRVMRNPRALRQVSIDDYAETIDNIASGGELYLTDNEATLLAPPVGARSRVGSIRLGLPAWSRFR